MASVDYMAGYLLTQDMLLKLLSMSAKLSGHFEGMYKVCYTNKTPFSTLASVRLSLCAKKFILVISMAVLYRSLVERLLFKQSAI